jgi:hypothetical protein
MTAKTIPFASIDASSDMGYGESGESLRRPTAILLPYNAALDKRLAADELTALTLLATYKGTSAAESVLVLGEYLRMGEERASRVKRKLNTYVTSGAARSVSRVQSGLRDGHIRAGAAHPFWLAALFLPFASRRKRAVRKRKWCLHLSLVVRAQLFRYPSDQPTLCLQRPDGAKVCARVGGGRPRR